jgi:hypothetical protein
MLNNIIKYYETVTDDALKNLSKEKTFQFRKRLTNHTLLKAVESHYEKITNSDEAKRMIKEYSTSMNNMYKVAKKDYDKALKQLKATKDPELKQKILNDYANKGIHGFTSKNGSHWNIETYSNMYTTHINNELVRLRVLEDANKNSKFKVSSHNCICNLCKPYENKILSKDGLEDARANGLFHPHCKHFILEVA